MVDEQVHAAKSEAPEGTAAPWPYRDRAQPEPRSPLGPVVVIPDSAAHAPVLPTPTSGLVGRATDLAFLINLIIDSDSRLITLTGPGGTGKTRLALAAAAATTEHFPDGAAFLDLAAIVRPALVLPTIAATLGLRERIGQERLHQLQVFVRPRRLLLVLDNFEQVLAAAAEVSQLLTQAPGLTVLVTSRAPLQLAGECEVPVPPLPLPEIDADPDQVLTAEAGRLFVQRVRAHDPAFTLDAEAASLVAEICARLDGLPLAIELAAARTRVLSLRQVRDRLDHRLQLLMQGTRDAPPRHTTMRDAIAWSYELLAPAEQALFRQLAVFAGGCTLEAAEYVGGRFAEGGAAPPSILDLISALVEQSLLERTIGLDGEPRFRMLETIREFALERLQSDEEVAARTAHAQYFLHLMRALQRLLRTRATSDPLTRLAADEANLRAAYDWFEERGPAPDFAAIAAASYTFWYALGRMRDAAAALERALCNRDFLSTAEGARLLIGKGEMLLAQGEAARAAKVLAESLPVVRTVGEAFDAAQALVVCGASWNYAEKYTEGDAYLAEALTVAETIADPTLRSATAGRALANLSVTARGLGKFALAEARCAEALRRYHEFGLDMAEIRVRMDLANIAIEQGDYQLAAERYLTCIEQIGDRGDMSMVAHALTGIGTAAIVWGQPQPAALLMAAAEALRERVGTALLLPHDRVMSDRNRAALLSALGAEAFTTTWAEGRQLSLSRAVTIAQSVTPADQPFAALVGRPDDRLTRRQIEVLRLMARWQTDREIADALFMSPRTASWHVHTILEKLGAQSRGEAVDLARAAGLL